MQESGQGGARRAPASASARARERSELRVPPQIHAYMRAQPEMATLLQSVPVYRAHSGESAEGAVPVTSSMGAFSCSGRVCVKPPVGATSPNCVGANRIYS